MKIYCFLEKHGFLDKIWNSILIKNYLTLLFLLNCFFLLGFIPFGTQFGDINVADGDDTASCFPVSKDFPLFTKKNRQQICVSEMSL